MTAFEQAWALLKSIQGDGPDPANLKPWREMSLAEIADEVGFGPIETPIEESETNQIFTTRPKIIPRRIDRTFQSRLPIDNLMTQGTPDRSEIIDGRYKLPLVHQSLAPITPLEQRLPKKPIPSHIEFNPNFGNHGMFELIGTEGQKLSRISPGQPIASLDPNTNPEIRDLYGETPPQFRRQDFYDKLYRGLLNAGIGIKSDSRNRLSGPFHEKLMNTMTPNISVTKPRGDTSLYAPIYYRRRDIPKFTMEELKQMQEEMPGLLTNDPNELEILASGLNRFDYGSLPIRVKQPNSQPTNVQADDISSQTSLDEYSPSNFRGIDAIRERHRIQNLFNGDGY